MTHQKTMTEKTMTEIVWTLQAQNDLRELGRYLDQSSSVYAESLVNALYNAVGSLSKRPLSGKILLQNRALREVASGNFRAIYALHGGTATIVAVVPRSE
jgi:plasmid stabilization system protein ParE